MVMAAQPVPWVRPPGSGCAAYDAWNRLAKVRIDDGDGSLDEGEADTLVAEFACDGLGRRITKEVKNSADRDCTYHYYYDLAWRRCEVRDGTGYVLKQYVWGTRYIDNIVQIGINTDPTDDEEGPQSNQCLCEDFYWPVQDANFNVVGLVDSSGTLKERYEYTPYGERTVYMKAGSDDTKTSAPLYASQPVLDSSLQPQAYSLCSIGHQGLFLDEEFGLYDNRLRVLHPRLARFMQRDPIGYGDGMSLYEYVMSAPGCSADPIGGAAIPTPGVPLGGSNLGVIPDQAHKNPALAEGIAKTMRDLCPCFSYDVSAGPRTRYGQTGIITPKGNPDYEDKMDFCCCYYEHLPGCNLLYKVATEGVWTPKGEHLTGRIPTKFGAEVDEQGLGLSDTSSGINAEEFSHGAYHIGEYAAKRAARLVDSPATIKDKTKPRGGRDAREKQPHATPVAELFKAIVDLVGDKFDCRSVVGAAHPARQRAQQSWDQADQLRKNVVPTVREGKMPPRYVP